MTSRSKHRVITDRLGIRAEAGEWCTIDKIPQPPAEVLQAVGTSRLRPGRLRPLGMVGAVIAVPFMPPLMLLTLLSNVEEAVKRSLATKDEKERLRAKDEDDRRRDATIAEQGLDRVFDGNWHGSAGQFLLRWYSHSTHHQRLVLATQDEIVLAAPPQRVTVGREKHMKIVARLPTAEATLVDPFSGEFETRMVLLRFRDGSWLRVETEEPRSDLHLYLLRRPLPDS
ncbi:hypothetical protein F7R91_22800 [Streptomyces luteolifulvus]|uniref:Uncharacterized protein n=1 Tax=Streptomyces luteolifulvus TaxID=2615112 RepID=A0A6H9UXV0_9ACTN|nr:hypothetical protein [Streptomyces luteolifulvus]KAB1144187.1 hypothetical protein F7R91_22800 [Streptomyces luteolifulvus]